MEKVYSSDEYYLDLLSEINKAKKYIYLQSMLFEYSDKIQKIESGLLKAAERGVEVIVNYDWVAQRYFHGELPKFPIIDREKRKLMSNVQKENKKMYRRLIDGGVKLNVTNNASLLISAFPYIGRNHIKLTIIDDKYCWIGGVNLYEDAFSNLDLMVKSDKSSLIKSLKILFHEINENKKEENYKIEIDSNETLYVDVGIKNKSIIYDTVISSIKNTKHNLTFMSQFVPDTKLLKEIELLADKGIKIIILTSPEEDSVFTSYPEKLTYVMLKKVIEQRNNIELIHLKKKVHAKLLIIDSNTAFYGSHNYIYSGVLFGTAEIMIKNSDNRVISQTEEFVESCKNIH